MGTSKFEKPYHPPSASTMPATSPTSPTYQSLPFSRRDFAHSSVASTTGTRSTAPTSLDSTVYRSSRDTGSKTESTSRHDSDLVDKEFGADRQSYDQGEDGWSATTKSNSDLTSDDLPSLETLADVVDFPIYDEVGNSHAFGSLFDPTTTTHQRQLIIFVRYFYCPACTAYLKSLAAGIPTQDCANIPTPTSITIIGCGHPDLITHYKQFTSCPFTIYADPTRTLFQRLGMGLTLKLGKRQPEYMAKGMLGASGDEISIIKKSLQDPEGIRKRDLLRGGHPMQVGGEFCLRGARWCGVIG